MALLWMDGIDRWGTNSVDFDLAYSRGFGALSFSAIGVSTTGGVDGGGSFTLTSEAALMRTVNSTLTAGGMVHAACWFKPPSLFDDPILVFTTNLLGLNVNSPNGALPMLRFNGLGQVYVNGHGSSTPIAVSANGVLTANTFYFLEYYAKWNTFANGGFVKVWVNGNIVCDSTLTSADAVSGTVPTTWVAAGGLHSTFQATTTYDDYIFWDETGTDFVHTQLSATYVPIIETRDVDGDYMIEFDQLSGSNSWEMIDDSAFHDGNTSYNFTTFPGRIDELTFENFSETPNAIYAVSVKTLAAISVSGTVNLRTRHNSGEVILESASRLLGTSYALYADLYGKNWNGAVDWTETTVNALRVGYKYHATPEIIISPEPANPVLSSSAPVVLLSEFISPSAQLVLSTVAPEYTFGEDMNLIQEVVTSGSQATVVFSSIPTTYRDLEIRVRARGDTAAAECEVRLQFNSDTGNNYDYQQLFANTATGVSHLQATSHIKTVQIPAGTATANFVGATSITIYDYKSTSRFKEVSSEGGQSFTTQRTTLTSGQWRSTSAINEVNVHLSAGSYVDGSIVSLYGVR